MGARPLSCVAGFWTLTRICVSLNYTMARVGAVILILVAACAGAAFLAMLVVRSLPWRSSRPDAETRNLVATISPEDVAEVKLEVWQARPVGTVRDREVIRLLVIGLKRATRPHPACSNWVDRATLRLKDGRTVGPLWFSADREQDAFSPDFVRGLRSCGVTIPRKTPEEDSAPRR